MDNINIVLILVTLTIVIMIMIMIKINRLINCFQLEYISWYQKKIALIFDISKCILWLARSSRKALCRVKILLWMICVLYPFHWHYMSRQPLKSFHRTPLYAWSSFMQVQNSLRCSASWVKMKHLKTMLVWLCAHVLICMQRCLDEWIFSYLGQHVGLQPLARGSCRAPLCIFAWATPMFPIKHFDPNLHLFLLFID